MNAPHHSKFALILSGGGARGAYEAGVLAYLRSELPEAARTTPFSVYCGSSVGAVNVCVMASFHTQPLMQGKMVRQAWENILPNHIYKRDLSAFSKFVYRSITGISGNVFKSKLLPQREHFVGLVDTSPFMDYLKRSVDWGEVDANVGKGLIHAIALAATNMESGEMELFLQKAPGMEYRGDFPVREVKLNPHHVMASAAIPILFPLIAVNGVYYGDGGLRLNTPLAPAIHLGADKLFVVGMHPIGGAVRTGRTARFADRPQKAPTLGDIIGTILNSLFVDNLEYDLKHMERINAIIQSGETLHGADFLPQLNRKILEHYQAIGINQHILKKRDVFSLFPSRDIREVFGSSMARVGRKRHIFTAFEKMLMKLLDVDSERGQEFLSYFFFLPEYIRDLIELGFNDAKAKHDALAAFFLD